MAVPGRARLRIEGLQGRPAFASRLQERINDRGAVHRVSASAITGNVLILFDARRLDLRGLLDHVTRDVAVALNGQPAAGREAEAAWHTLGVRAALERLDTDATTGLSADEAIRRLATIGENRLPAPQPKSALAIVAHHLTSLPVLLLGGAAALSLLTGAVTDAVVILAVVGANAVVGYLTESRVERILTSLQNAVVPQAFVRREGRELMLPATELVPGDIMILKAGHDVPADGRLAEAAGLAVDEAALTGESLPVQKAAAAPGRLEAALADRLNMVFAGTVVAEGSGIAIVVGTGRDTEIGRIRALVAETATPPTPLERQLDRMGGHLVAVSLGFCAVTLGLGLLRGVPLMEMLRTAISLAVAAVPEGLPAVATTTLALGMQRMMRHQTLVRRLASVEGLGATTVICIDKTGTLTENRMTVHAWYLSDREYRADGNGGNSAELDQALARAVAIGVLCNEAELPSEGSTLRGSSTETALLSAAADAGLDYRLLRGRHPLLTIHPRVDGDNWMATVHKDGLTRVLIAVKGAPEEVIERATHWLQGKTSHPMSPGARDAILDLNARVAARGMRVLGLAFKQIAADVAPTYNELTWVGLVALRDPIRAGVREAIVACRRAGIRPVIITGDQAHTAAAIGRQLGLVSNGEPRVLDGSQLGSMDPATLSALAAEVDIFARVSPAHKYQIVRALQARGHVVAMTGDGINDAAALRAADTGVAMGVHGTEVARDVADVVLLDDNFGSIVRAVEQGRTIHANIRKTLKFLLSTNFSEILVTLGALTVGIARPMSAIQFLWINLLSDVGPALALALEPPEPDAMARPPRDPAEPILSRPVLTEIGGDAAVLSLAALGVHGLAVARYGAGPRATTLAFSTLTSAQLIHALSCRSRVRSGFTTPGDNPLLVGVVGGSLALQLAATTVPALRGLLGTTTLSPSDWLLAAGGAVIPAVIGEIKRAVAMPNGAALLTGPRQDHGPGLSLGPRLSQGARLHQGPRRYQQEGGE